MWTLANKTKVYDSAVDRENPGTSSFQDLAWTKDK